MGRATVNARLPSISFSDIHIFTHTLNKLFEQNTLCSPANASKYTSDCNAVYCQKWALLLRDYDVNCVKTLGSLCTPVQIWTNLPAL